MPTPWPYLTADKPGLPATIRSRYEDFRIEELPLYEPCGEGEHLYVRIEKTGLTTRQAVARIARALGLKPHAIGTAGRKDAHGVAQQTLSLAGVDPETVQALELEGLRILEVARHRNKLRIGHLRANSFHLKLRETDTARVGEVRELFELLAYRGVPNYYGPQRFGIRGDTWEIGRALLRGEELEAVRIIAGRPSEVDQPKSRRARELFEAGDYRAAAAAWPEDLSDMARLCGVMARTKSDAKRALRTLGKDMLKFYLSAYQSWLFNRVVVRRIDTLDQVFRGDLAHKHANGAVFLVEDAQREQPRAAQFEISATGPMFGHKMKQPRSEPARLEEKLLHEAGVRLEDFPRCGPMKSSGARRPLRFQPQQVRVEAGTDEAGPFMALRFQLPPGCYATAVLRELCKDELVEATPGQD